MDGYMHQINMHAKWLFNMAPVSVCGTGLFLTEFVKLLHRTVLLQYRSELCRNTGNHVQSLAFASTIRFTVASVQILRHGLFHIPSERGRKSNVILRTWYLVLYCTSGDYLVSWSAKRKIPLECMTRAEWSQFYNYMITGELWPTDGLIVGRS